MKRRRLMLATLAAATSCGLPTSSHVDRVNPRNVPFELLSPTPGSTATPQSRGPITSIYLIKGARLAPLQRHVVGTNVPAEAVRLLLQGPDGRESAQGFTTDVPTQTRLISLDLTGPVATVDLSDEFGTLGGSDQVAAVAQIVYTLTASRYIDAVRFAINGKLADAPDGRGSLAATPRTRADFPHLAP